MKFENYDFGTKCGQDVWYLSTFHPQRTRQTYLPNVLRAQLYILGDKDWICVLWRILNDVVDVVGHRTSIFGCGGLGRLQDLCHGVSR